MDSKKKPTFSLSSKIFIALILGICAGLFFGDLVAFLEIVGDIFIKLLQMTVVPYVILSLVFGLGRLDYKQAFLLAKKGGMLLLLIWAISIGVVFLFPFAFPDWYSSSFFSTSQIQPKESVDFVKLFIPSNPFYSIANSLIPGVVLFCIFLGVALIGIKEKSRLMENISVLMDALTRVTNFVVSLTPIGVFAITASASGTMGLTELKRMEVYLFTYVVFSLVMSLWILPALVTTLTPLKYKQVIGLTKDALVTAFATSSLFIVLPILAERCKEMTKQSSIDQNEAESAIDVIIPASFNFPHAGKLFTFSFILFAGWFSGFDVAPTEYPLLVGSGLMSLFANVNIAVPFLLDIMEIPSDTFQFFIATSVINARFGTLLAAVHVLALTLLTAFAMNDQVRIQWLGLLKYLLISGCLLLLIVTGSKLFLTNIIKDSYVKGTLLASMPLSRKSFVGKVYSEPPEPLKQALPGQTRLNQIVERGLLRVCYHDGNNMPFSYFNNYNQLVGFDIELLGLFGDDLNIAVEFVPATMPDFSKYFREGYCDIGTGQPLSPALSIVQGYSHTYIDYTLAFLVKDHNRHKFQDLNYLQQQELLIAVSDMPYYQRIIHAFLPRAELLIVDSHSSYIDNYSEKADAFVTVAEMGSAWTLVYPEYAVATPFSNSIKVPAAFPIPLGEDSMANILNNWLILKEKEGTIANLFNYWILGLNNDIRSPRWSIIRDVLHWVE